MIKQSCMQKWGDGPLWPCAQTSFILVYIMLLKETTREDRLHSITTR